MDKGEHSVCLETLAPIQDKLTEVEFENAEPSQTGAAPAPGAAASKTIGGKYVPPSLRNGGRGRGESMGSKDESATIRVSNLSEDTRKSDLLELFRPFGSIYRIYLIKDKNTGRSKGFAFINFHRRDDAAKAIAGVSGFDHLMRVEWAKPSRSK